MPRLLFVSRYIDHILGFFLEQLAREFELTVIVDQQNAWTERLQAEGIELHHLAPRGRFDRRFREQIDAIRGERDWDLIQNFHGNAQLANLIQWNRRRLPLIGYRASIGNLKFRQNPTAYWNVRNPSLAAVSAVSHAVKEYLESFRFLRANNVHVLHHGINRQWVASRMEQPFGLRERLGIDDDALIVTNVANIRPFKRFDYIVHAAEKLAAEPIHFVHIGDPSGWDKKAAHLPKVHFLGKQHEPFPILGESDIFAMTSHEEPFGRANLEAMACGKPVIGSNTGGLLDLVAPGETGQLFDTQSTDAFTEAVRSYLNDRDAVARHGQNAIERVDRLFSTESMVARYRKLYQSLLA